MSGGRQNRPIQLTEILNIPKFSVWQIRKNARSYAWIAWSEPTLKSTRKSGRHYSRVTQCVPAWPWFVQDVCRLLQVTSITGNQLYLILTVLVFFKNWFIPAVRWTWNDAPKLGHLKVVHFVYTKSLLCVRLTLHSSLNFWYKESFLRELLLCFGAFPYNQR